jgi:magnesium-transporting ATPase (P-type)
MTDY